jgi:hypothetical protein
MQLVNSTHNSARRRYNPISPQWDLGLAVLEAHARYGACFGYDEIALACGVTPQAVRTLTLKAIRRLQPRLAAEKRLLQ